MADRIPTKWMIGALISLNIIAYLLFGLFGSMLWALILGVILLDLGVQGTQVANQTRIYALEPQARSRLNTVQMVTTFLGGAIGSSVGSYAWHIAGWTGVCFAGGIVGLLSFSVWLIHSIKN
jgi:predicted MFS family arabinose efflux permease